MRLYTIDINPNLLDEESGIDDCIAPKEEKELLAMKVFRQGSRSPVEMLSRDADIARMREPYEFNEDFTELCNEGYSLYIEGRFSEACHKLKLALREIPEDGPTRTLIDFMEGEDGQHASMCWKGFRELQEK